MYSVTDLSRFFRVEYLDRDCKPEFGADIQFRLNSDDAVHQLHQLSRYRKPQSCTSKTAGRRIVGLLEGYEQQLYITGGQSNTGIPVKMSTSSIAISQNSLLDGKFQPHFVGRHRSIRFIYCASHLYRSVCSKLDSIPDQVHQNYKECKSIAGSNMMLYTNLVVFERNQQRPLLEISQDSRTLVNCVHGGTFGSTSKDKSSFLAAIGSKSSIQSYVKR